MTNNDVLRRLRYALNLPDGLTNITVVPGIALGALVDPGHSTVAIVTPPANATAAVGRRAIFSVQATGSSDLGPHVVYQWRRNGVDIPGANSAAYLTPELGTGDDGALFS